VTKSVVIKCDTPRANPELPKLCHFVVETIWFRPYSP